MAEGSPPLVAFLLIAFAAFALPSAIAFVLFGLVRKDPPGSTPTVRRPDSEACRRGFRRDRFGRLGRE